MQISQESCTHTHVYTSIYILSLAARHIHPSAVSSPVRLFFALSLLHGLSITAGSERSRERQVEGKSENEGEKGKEDARVERGDGGEIRPLCTSRGTLKREREGGDMLHIHGCSRKSREMQHTYIYIYRHLLFNFSIL